MLKRRIKRITIKNYRSIADLTVEMPDLMVLVGENGSGKSNFVDALRFLRDVMRNGLEIAISKRGGISQIRRWSPTSELYNVTIEVETEIDSALYFYSLVLESTESGEYRIKNEHIEYNNHVIWDLQKNIQNIPFGKMPTYPTTLVLPILGQSETTPMYLFLRDMNFSAVYPNTLRKLQEAMNPFPLDEHGENFSSALREIISKGKYQQRKQNILTYLNLISEGIEDFDVVQFGKHLLVQVKHTDGSKFELSQESDGTLRALAVLLALYQEPNPSLLVLEEPELFVHPRVVDILCEVIEGASMRQQIIVTTHSPDLIARFSVDTLRIVEKTSSGTQIAPIDEYQRQLINDGIFKTSDLLRVEGLRREEA